MSIHTSTHTREHTHARAHTHTLLQLCWSSIAAVCIYMYVYLLYVCNIESLSLSLAQLHHLVYHHCNTTNTYKYWHSCLSLLNSTPLQILTPRIYVYVYVHMYIYIRMMHTYTHTNMCVYWMLSHKFASENRKTLQHVGCKYHSKMVLPLTHPCIYTKICLYSCHGPLVRL
jgi:hypothetical protein